MPRYIDQDMYAAECIDVVWLIARKWEYLPEEIRTAGIKIKFSNES